MNPQFIDQLTPQQKNFDELMTSAKKKIQEIIDYVNKEDKAFFSLGIYNDYCIEVRYLGIPFIIRIQYKYEKAPSYRIQLIAYIRNRFDESDFSINQITFRIDKKGNIESVSVKDSNELNEDRVINDNSEAEFILEKIITVLDRFGYTKTY